MVNCFCWVDYLFLVSWYLDVYSEFLLFLVYIRCWGWLILVNVVFVEIIGDVYWVVDCYFVSCSSGGNFVYVVIW